MSEEFRSVADVISLARLELAGRPDDPRVSDRFDARLAELVDVDAEIEAALTNVANGHTDENSGFWFAAAHVHLSRRYLTPLENIVGQAAPKRALEWAVELLMELHDPSSVEVLIRATTYELIYDPGREMAAKAIEALLNIGTDKAVRHVESLVTHESAELRYHASDLLDDEE